MELAHYDGQVCPPRLDDIQYLDPPPGAQSSRHTSAEFVSLTPTFGQSGTKVSVDVRSVRELSVDTGLCCIIIFGTRRCGAALNRTRICGQYYEYTFRFTAPPFDTIGSLELQVPLMLEISVLHTTFCEKFSIGSFTYLSYSLSKDTDAALNPSGLDVSSSGFPGDFQGSLKRSISARPKSEGSDYYSASEQLQSQAQYLSQRRSHDALDRASGVLISSSQDYGRPNQTLMHRTDSLASAVGSMSASPMTLQRYSPRPSYQGSDVYQRSLPALMYMTSHSNSSPAVSTPSNPTLIRTSTMLTPPHASSRAFEVAQLPEFNPYALYQQKANLKLDGDLDGLAEGWSEEERRTQRRLVQFHRGQTGSTITASFKPVKPDERQPHSICVSCIWWQGKGECFVTSVDTIYLLEALVNVRFTVEEKNRIRRNLEGFRPQTVSKAKPDSEEFFKVIMGFPNPKPRNIEKDVKVFPWRILSHALKKIISKYVSR